MNRYGTRFARPVLLACLAIILLAGLQPGAQAQTIDHNSFQRTWARTDQPVSAGQASRTWMWGPSFTDLVDEAYAQSPGGYRIVQYFDKSRMEITNPNAVDDGLWYVTNGLLVKELITGDMQVGDNSYVDRSPAQVNVAGDPGAGPTYAALGNVLGAPALPVGATITQRLAADGSIHDDASLADRGVRAAAFVSQTNHTVAQPFWDFMNSSGLVSENGATVTAPLFQSPYYATGYPITEAYWTWVSVGGTPKDVLIQCFERRCLTYTPDNPAGWQVEAGNVGLHYYQWRYPGGHQLAAPRGTDGRAAMISVSGNAFTWEPDWDKYATHLRDSNVGRARIELPWDFIQKHRDSSFDFGLHDPLVDGYIAQGVEPYGMLGYSVGWASGGSDNDSSKVFGPPTDLDAWEEYVYQTVSHFKGRIKYWEVWNEPDVAFFWGGKDGGDPDYYAQMLQRAYTAAKRADPDAIVMNGGVTGTERGINYVKRLLDLGAAKYLDVIGFHGYVSDDGLDTDVYPNLIWPGISNLHNTTGKPIWFTEMGWNTACSGSLAACSEEEQRNRVVRNLTMLFGISGVELVSVFQFKDPGDNPNYFGIVQNNAEERLAYTAIQTLSDRLTGLSFERRVDYGNGNIWGMRFSGDGRSVEIIWATSGEHDVTVGTGGYANAFVHRLDGSWSYRRPNNGGVMLHAARDPIIVEASN